MTGSAAPWYYPFFDLLPQGARDYLDQGGWWLVLVVAATLVLIVLLILRSAARQLFGQRPARDMEASLEEDLAEYPPAPGAPLRRRLVVEGYPARLRLVVLAPVGKATQIDAANAEPLLEHVLRGLGSVARQDRPRVRVWPSQLSHPGFAVTFHRLTHKPEPEGSPSHWTLLAGRARVGPHYLLLGLALWTEEPTTLGRRTFEPDQWAAVLHTQELEG
jgi:hypothetical protein